MFFIFLILTIFAANVFADDLAVSDIITADVILEDANFPISIVVTNNSSSITSVDLNVFINDPSGTTVAFKQISGDVNAQDTRMLSTVFTDVETTGSVNSHTVSAIITNDFPDGSPANNAYRKYVVVSKSDKKVPVPDFPIILSILLGIFVAFFAFNETKFSKNK